ncbi:MFS transporter, partial [Candidatus Bathyarchaeota archaeon]|nr:MFS transporter [Candidatus Bathyarchaeota archaeon]
FSLPGGILADRYGRRKIIVWGTFLRTFSPLLYFLAPNWQWIIVAALFNGFNSLYMPAFQAIVADSIPSRSRGTGYGAYSTFTSIPMFFSPAIGGFCMDQWGYVDGIKRFLAISVVVNLIVTYVRWKYIKETLDTKRNPKNQSRFSMKSVTDQPKPIKVMLWVAVIGSFSTRLVMDFTNLYALDVIKITNTQLGLVQTIVGLLMAALALPAGMLSDKYGRKNNIMLSRVANPITQWLLAYTTDFPMYAGARFFNGVAMAFGGGGGYAGGPSWSALIADIVPPNKRATVIGTQNTVSALVGAPSAILGGWLWQIYSPQTPFIISGVIGLVAAGLFWWGVDEPTKEEKLELIEKHEKEVAERAKDKG